MLAGSWSISTVFGRELARFEAVLGREFGQLLGRELVRFSLCSAGSWCEFSCARQLIGSGRELVRFYCFPQGVGQICNCARQRVGANLAVLGSYLARQGVGQVLLCSGGSWSGLQLCSVGSWSVLFGSELIRLSQCSAGSC